MSVTEKLAEARTAFFNTNPLIRMQAAHVIVPLLEAMEMLAQLVRELEADSLPGADDGRFAKLDPEDL